MRKETLLYRFLLLFKWLNILHARVLLISCLILFDLLPSWAHMFPLSRLNVTMTKWRWHGKEKKIVVGFAEQVANFITLSNIVCRPNFRKRPLTLLESRVLCAPLNARHSASKTIKTLLTVFPSSNPAVMPWKTWWWMKHEPPSHVNPESNMTFFSVFSSRNRPSFFLSPWKRIQVDIVRDDCTVGLLVWNKRGGLRNGRIECQTAIIWK